MPAKPKLRPNVEDGIKECVKRPDANLQAITPTRSRVSHPPSTPAKPKLSILQAEKACEGVKGNIQRVQGNLPNFYVFMSGFSNQILPVLRHLLNIESPTYNVSTTQDRQGAQCFEAKARFLSDPYLRRAGVVGCAYINGGTPDRAIEACAGEVLEYLMRMINGNWEEESKPEAQTPSVSNTKIWREKAAAARAVAVSCSRAASSLTARSDGLAIRGHSTSSSTGLCGDDTRKNNDATPARLASPTPLPLRSTFLGKNAQGGTENK